MHNIIVTMTDTEGRLSANHMNYDVRDIITGTLFLLVMYIRFGQATGPIVHQDIVDSWLLTTTEETVSVNNVHRVIGVHRLCVSARKRTFAQCGGSFPTFILHSTTS